MKPIYLFILCSLLLAGCAQNADTLESRETLYQVSTINSLLAGNYDGIESIEMVKKKGDLGIGTFNELDGEMVMINGHVYQVKDSGKVEEPPDSVKLPFSAVTFFDTDVTQELGAVQNLDALKAELDKLITEKDKFYAIRIEGSFNHVKVRSVPKQQKPYPVLSEVTKKQSVFDFDQPKGTLVGFWCPDYVGAVNVPGYHLHFISDDRTQGGHLLDVNLSSATIKLDTTRFFAMELGVGSGQNNGSMDTQGEINKVEK